MKIAKGDKELIVNTVKLTLLAAEQEKSEAPEKLLLEIYTEWFNKYVGPYKNNPLYDLIHKESSLTFRIKPQNISRFKGGAYTQYNKPHMLTTEDKLVSSNLPTGMSLINTGGSGFGSKTIIDTTKLSSALQDKINKHNAQIAASRTYIMAEAERLTKALDQVNTYKQLESKLPVIFNSMPMELKEKYRSYQLRAKQRRQQKEEVEVEDFSALGTTLAVQSLKKVTSEE